ncbi:SMP-30/gluconolactonase/LRE family protein [Sporomusa malonica]|uniref:DNA-binding beta-propeller fold protein YncE n=1 Tax=Sporomusa malonica TaxID=112901 RepID=A0A1W2F650_9FIRM|nr:SMP-30/gluconolactonase/LRE family protein [Sporomusa malonica]SMD17430.1 DNA-binding beta-propeller fold protein YncE [Sporomusa malonica]
MKKKIVSVIFGFCFLVSGVAQAFTPTIPKVQDPAYGIRLIVTPSNLGHGTNGLNFDAKDNLYVTSVAAAATYLVNTDTGESSVYLAPPSGGADDLVFGKDGTVYWNAFFLGKVYKKTPDGKIVTLADDMPGANAIALGKDGRLFVTQCFLGDGLWEIDKSGQQKNRKIAEKLGGPNASMFGPDGLLYTPLWFKGQIIKTNVDTGERNIVAEGFKIPSATKFDSHGNLFCSDTATGEIYKVNAKSGDKAVVAKLSPHLDNIAFDSKDRLFVTNMNVNGVYQVDVPTGKVRPVVEEAKLCYPQGIAVANDPNGDTVYVADNFAYKKIDAFSGNVEAPLNGSSFTNTASISADGNYILMSGWFTNKVQVFDRKTDKLLYTVSGFKVVAGTLMLNDGSIVVAEHGAGDIVRVTDKEGTEKTVVTSGLVSPTYIAPAGQNAIYVTEYTPGRITKVDLNTGEKKTICTGLKGPKGIAVKPDGKIIVVVAGSHQLLEIDPDSGKSKPIVNNLAVGQPGEVRGGHPAYSFTGVAVSNSGAIYVTSDLENTVYQIFPK